MSFRNSHPSHPSARQRSSSTVRNSPNVNSSPSSYPRPRSAGYFGSNSNIYAPSQPSTASNYYPSTYNTATTPQYNNLSTYTSNYRSPYFQNDYRGSTASNGYASLTIPAKSYKNSSNVSNYAKKYEAGRQNRPVSRTGSFSRDRSLSRSQSSLNSLGMGSKSISLTSLNSLASEGYISGTEKSSRSSRLGSASDLVLRGENGEIDYKRLYEQTLVENDRLKDKLRKTEDELKDTKQTLERINTVTSKNSLSELEKRERRAMERKLSEMEEELKQLQKLKAENERLRAENRALTRVVSKLTNSAKK